MKIGDVIVTIDPHDYVFPLHKFDGRVGVVTRISPWIEVEFKWQLGDKFLGKKVIIPFTPETYEQYTRVLNKDSKLFKLVYS